MDVVAHGSAVLNTGTEAGATRPKRVRTPKQMARLRERARITAAARRAISGPRPHNRTPEQRKKENFWARAQAAINGRRPRDPEQNERENALARARRANQTLAERDKRLAARRKRKADRTPAQRRNDQAATKAKYEAKKVEDLDAECAYCGKAYHSLFSGQQCCSNYCAALLKTKPKGVCGAAGCVQIEAVGGFCNAHFIRHLRGVDVVSVVIPLRSTKTNGGIFCREDGCSAPSYSLGLCLSHYQKAYRASWSADRALLEFARKSAKRYDISVDLAMAMYRRQVCDLCGLPPTSNRRWCIDHHHPSGEIRGAVHMHCNFLIGDAEKYPHLFVGTPVAAYLHYYALPGATPAMIAQAKSGKATWSWERPEA